MTTETAFGDLASHVAAHGPAAHLVTVGEDGRPHVTAVLVESAGGALRVDAGTTSSRNAAANPAVTLLWPPAPGGVHSLMVDGTAAAPTDPGAAGLSVTPTSALLHRVADAPDGIERCFRVVVPS